MRIVLVHGSWHTGELWGPVAAILRQAGHEVHTPTIAGHGVGVNKRVTHAQCSQSITDYVVANDLNDIVLLATATAAPSSRRSSKPSRTGSAGWSSGTPSC